MKIIFYVAIATTACVVTLLGAKTTEVEVEDVASVEIVEIAETEETAFNEIVFEVIEDQAVVEPVEIEIVDVPDVVVAEPDDVVEPWYTDAEFKLLCQLVMAEGGADIIPDEAQQGIAAVIINRTRYPQHFGSTIEEVIFYPGQYSCSGYVRTLTPTARVVENVRKVMDAEVVIPEDVVWQSGFPQCAWNTQVDIYAYYDTSPNDIYLCHWGK